MVRYEGIFKTNVKHGRGRLVFDNGEECSGSRILLLVSPKCLRRVESSHETCNKWTIFFVLSNVFIFFAENYQVHEKKSCNEPDVSFRSLFQATKCIGHVAELSHSSGCDF